MPGTVADHRVAATARARPFPLRRIAWCVMLAYADAGWANPVGPAVAAGAANFSTVGKTLTVRNTPGTIINWQAFSIAAGERTRFVQQSSASSVMNRVTGPDPSSILGTLSSNGRVLLINPNGLVFGSGSVVSTAGFIGSTLNMSDQDFLQGRIRFEGGGQGGVRNEGTIRATGDIMLVGPTVENAGLIRSKEGSVVLAAGRAVTVTSPDAHGVTFTLQAPTDTAVNLGKIEAANAASMLAGTLRHSGDMHVRGSIDGAGRVVLRAQQDALVQSGSTISARGAQGGSVTVESGGQTLVSGAIDATGIDKGGSIRLLGQEVGVRAGARVDASGGNGAGTILIGGDYKGANPAIRNALLTTIDAGAAVHADATRHGDGGRVIVWSDGHTNVHGLISARGAGAGSIGGFVETSGHYLKVTRPPEIGAGGTWLLDPYNLFVTGTTTTTTGTVGSGVITYTPTADDSQVANTDLNAQLDAGINVILDTTGGPGSQPGNIIVNAPITKINTNTASLTFNAQNDVTINAGINLLNGGGDFNVTTLNATSTMSVNSTSVLTAGAMNLSLAGALVVQTGSAANAMLYSSAGQTIAARSIAVSTTGSGAALLDNAGAGQTITVNNANSGSGIDVVSTGAGVARISNATIALAGTAPGAPPPPPFAPQNITVNSGDRLRVIGSTGSVNGTAQIVSNAAAQTIVLQGAASANAIELGSATAAGTSELIAQSQSITAGQAGQAGSITIRGGVSDNRVAAIASTGAGNQSVVTTGTITAIAGSDPIGTSGHDAVIRHIGTGNQSITAGGVNLQAGSGTGNDAALIVTSTTGGSQTLTVGAGGINATGGSGNTFSDAEIVQNSTGQAQTINVNGGGSIVLQGGSGTTSNQARITAAGPTQTINFTAGGNLEITGGTNGTLNGARITSTAAGMQTVTGATGITLTGGASGGGLDGAGNTVGNRAQIKADVGSQSVSVGAGGITLAGGGGPMTNNSAEIEAGNAAALLAGTTQTITVNNGGTIAIRGGSTALTNVTNGPNQVRGSFAQISSSGDTQQIDFTAGGAINLTGGTVGSDNVAQIRLRFAGNQVITGAPAITITGGASGGTQNGTRNEGNRARIIANEGNQNITAGAVTLVGGAGGLNNNAQIVTLAAGTTQTLSATGITMTGGAGGGGFVTGPFSTRGNFAQIRGSGDQTVTVGAGGITMTGGAGPLTDNFASLFQSDTAPGRRQQITVNGGGSVTLTGGSSSGAADLANSSGSFSFITSAGGAGQTIDFGAPGSAITLTGGTVGTGNAVGIIARNGPQTITGSPTITLTGGASGGVLDAGNNANIEAQVGVQTIAAAATQLTGGPGGNNNNATIRARTQDITVNGNLTQTGSTGGSGRTGARIGSAPDDPTDLTLTVNGNLTLNGGGVADSGATIGISANSTTVQTANIAIDVSGDVALNAGTAGFARIGQPTALLGGGDISLIAGGNITLTGSAAAEANISTAGNVTVRADSAGKSITQAGANARVRANMLIASAHSGIVMNGNNAVTSLNATNTAANGIQFTQAPGLPLTLMGMPQTGGNVVVTADDMNITAGITAGTSDVVLRPTTLSRPINIEATPTVSTLSLTPAELDQITAGVLDIGRLDGTGVLSVNTALADGDINAATLRLFDNDINVNAAIGSATTALAKNLDLRAANNTRVLSGGIFLADNRNLAIVANNDSVGTGDAGIGGGGAPVTVRVGTSTANTGAMLVQGNLVSVTAAGGGSTSVQVQGAGNQTFTAADDIFIANNSTFSTSVSAGTGTQSFTVGTGDMRIVSSGAPTTVSTGGGLQTVTVGQGLTLLAGAGPNARAQLSSGGQQTINARGIEVIGGGGADASNAFAQISANTNQLITVGSDGIVVKGGVGTGTAGNNGASILQQNTGLGFIQDIIVNNGGSISAEGGSTAQTGVNGSSAIIRASGGNQSVDFTAGGSITITGGTVGARNNAQLRHLNAAGTQTITGVTGIIVTGGASGGLEGTNAATDSAGNFASVRGDGSQMITVGSGGITIVGGAGNFDNFAQVREGPVTGNPAAGSVQAITVTGGGTITLQGGSSSGTATVDGSGSSASLRGEGDAQTIAFTSGGAIVMTGGSVGTSNEAGIRTVRATQTITGSPTVTMTAGSSGGATDNGNHARIRSEVSQDLTLGTVQMTGGGGGVDNFSNIDSPVQNITVNGSLTLTGSSGGTGSAGSRIGGIRNGATDLDLTVTGNVTLNGGAIAGAGSAIGPSGNSATPQSAAITLNAGGNVTLNGGTAAGTRIGQPAGLVGGGDIVVTSGGSIAFVDAGTTSGNVRTTGNVTLRADAPGGTIVQGANSVIAADDLTVSANDGISLNGANQVDTVNVNAGAGGFSFTSAQPVEVDAGTVVTPAGAQLISITTTGAASDITFTGAVSSDDILLFTSARDIVFSGGSSVTANTLSLAGPGTARFPGGTVTLDTDLIAALPVSITGATVNANGTTVFNNGLALSGGALQGAGPILVTAGTFAWSGGTLGGGNSFSTGGPSEVTGPVSLDGRTWINLGVANLSGTGRIALANNAVLFNHPGATFNIASTDTMPIAGGGSIDNGGVLNNEGPTAHTLDAPLINTGQINVNGGMLTLTGFPVNAGGVTIVGGATLSTGGAALTNSTTGTIMGTGTLNLAGATLANNGTVAPGTSPGTLVIEGDFTQSDTGVLAVEIAGTQQGQTYDFLQVNGTANLGGTLRVEPINGFTPASGETFNFLTYRSRTGDFMALSSPGNVVFQQAPMDTSYSVLATASFTPAMGEIVRQAPSNDVTVLSENATGTGSSRESDRTGDTTTARSSEEEQKKASTQECR